jgi:hypothetical protein
MAFALDKITYQTSDGRSWLKVISGNELEYRHGGTTLLCKYSVEDGSLRVVLTILGSQQVLYFKRSPDGFVAESGEHYLTPASLGELHRRAQAARQAEQKRQQAEAAARAQAERRAAIEAQRQAEELAAARRPAETPTREIGKYAYLSGGGNSYMAKEAWGTLTLSDVGFDLSGEQTDGTVKKETLTFYEVFASASRQGGLTIYRIKQRQGWGGISVIMYGIDRGAGVRPERSFSFHTVEERDHFFDDLKSALGDWAARYPRFGNARIDFR